jgi:hypothetical protein
MIRWLFAIDLTIIAVVTFLRSDPMYMIRNDIPMCEITFEGTWFVTGIILSPLIFRN